MRAASEHSALHMDERFSKNGSSPLIRAILFGAVFIFVAKLLNYYQARVLIVSATFFFFLRLHFCFFFFIYCQLLASKKRAAFMHSNGVQIFVSFLLFKKPLFRYTIKTRRYTTYLVPT